MGWLNSRMRTEGRFSESKYGTVEITQYEQQRETKLEEK